jgi:hypothetical protein
MMMCIDHGIYILEMYDLYPLRLLRYFYICMLFWILLRRSIYFSNICFIRVFYRFNRNKALQVGIRAVVSLVWTSIR